MGKSFTKISAAMGTLALAVQLQAGGFWVVLGNPEASPEARAMNAVLTAKAAGCHDPAKATLTATAIGVVGGKRQEIPLKLTALKEPGMYALAKQWPSQGRWVIQIVGHNSGMITYTLVPAGADGVERVKVKQGMGEPAAEEVEAMLRGEPAAVAKK